MAHITPDVLDRARGCLVGAAIGDAFGMALLGAARQPVGAQVRELRRGRLAAGQFTENTGSMLAVAENWLAHGSLDAEALAKSLAAAQPGGSRGAPGAPLLGWLLGPSTPPPPAEPAPGPQPSPADARPLVRAMPLALANIGNLFACLDEARIQSRVTHPQIECVAGSAFIAGTLWHLLQGMPPREAMRQALGETGDLPEGVARSIRQAPGRMRDQLTNASQVEPILVSVTWGFLTTVSFTEAVTRVANLGGDAATAAALVGGLGGAAYRYCGIQADWRLQVHGTWPQRGGRLWRAQDLLELADRLLQTARQP